MHSTQTEAAEKLANLAAAFGAACGAAIGAFY